MPETKDRIMAGQNRRRETLWSFSLLGNALDVGTALRNTIVAVWGRTGFDFAGTPEAACRGRFVGLVNHSNQKLKANQELALAA